MKVVLTNYGATIMRIELPDCNGERKNVVAGFHSPEDYLQTHPFFGCTVGRYANRIANGRFRIQDTTYELSVNDPPNHLHGGFSGFDKKVWTVQQVVEETEMIGVTFSYRSADGEEGYPGTLDVTGSFFLNAKNELQIIYQGIADKPTIVNLTNHAYFNLSGFESPDIYRHRLKLCAGNYLQTDRHHIPTGIIQTVKGSNFDFTDALYIGDHLEKLIDEDGIDHTFIINAQQGKETVLAAELFEPVSGRAMKMFTNQAGLQVYTANGWDGSLQHSNGVGYQKHGAIALETQAFPDAPNHPQFMNTVLLPGERYYAETRMQFAVINA